MCHVRRRIHVSCMKQTSALTFRKSLRREAQETQMGGTRLRKAKAKKWEGWTVVITVHRWGWGMLVGGQGGVGSG